jgi:hypothetical protein
MRLFPALAVMAGLGLGQALAQAPAPLQAQVSEPQVTALGKSIFLVRVGVKANRDGSIEVKLGDTGKQQVLHDEIAQVGDRQQWIEFTSTLHPKSTLIITEAVPGGAEIYKRELTPPPERDREGLLEALLYTAAVCVFLLYIWALWMRKGVAKLQSDVISSTPETSAATAWRDELNSRITNLKQRISGADTLLAEARPEKSDLPGKIAANEATLKKLQEILLNSRPGGPTAPGAPTSLPDLVKEAMARFTGSLESIRKSLEAEPRPAPPPAEAKAISSQMVAMEAKLQQWGTDSQRRESLLAKIDELERSTHDLEQRLREREREKPIPTGATRFDWCVLWASALQRIAPELSGRDQPSDYLAQLTILEAALNEAAAPTGWSRLAHLVHVTSLRGEGISGMPRDRQLELHAIRRGQDGTVAGVDDEDLTGREYYQIYLALDHPDGGATFLFLPPGAFNSDRHPLVLNCLLADRSRAATRIYNVVDPAHLRPARGSVYEVESTMKVLFDVRTPERPEKPAAETRAEGPGREAAV